MATQKFGNKGDTIDIFFDYEKEGIPLADCTDIANLECQFMKAGSYGDVNKTTKNGTITLDSSSNMYKCKLSQEETFSLPTNVKVHIRCLDDNDNVVSSDITNFILGDVLSSTILEE